MKTLIKKLDQELAKEKQMPSTEQFLDLLDNVIINSLKVKAMLNCIEKQVEELTEDAFGNIIKDLAMQRGKERFESVDATYNSEENILTIKCEESKIDPKFLKYMLEYKGIPQDVKVIYDSPNK